MRSRRKATVGPKDNSLAKEESHILVCVGKGRQLSLEGAGSQGGVFVSSRVWDPGEDETAAGLCQLEQYLGISLVWNYLQRFP